LLCWAGQHCNFFFFGGLKKWKKPPKKKKRKESSFRDAIASSFPLLCVSFQALQWRKKEVRKESHTSLQRVYRTAKKIEGKKKLRERELLFGEFSL
jgi:hypothetical protein